MMLAGVPAAIRSPLEALHHLQLGEGARRSILLPPALLLLVQRPITRWGEEEEAEVEGGEGTCYRGITAL